MSKKTTSQEPMNEQDYVQTIQLSAKDHIVKLEHDILNLQQNLDVVKKHAQEIKLELDTFGNQNNQFRNELQDLVMEQSIRVNNYLKQIQQTETQENNFLKLQIGQITNDKIKIQQNTLVLENSIAESEKDLGYKYYYDQIKNSQTVTQG